MGIASSRQRQQNNQEVEVNDNQVINERSAEDDRRQRRHLLSDEDNRGANDDGKYGIFSLKKLSRNKHLPVFPKEIEVRNTT